jgi:prevent-host-death family protein
MNIGAGEFKTNCLKLMDQVQRDRKSITITKRGKPVAKLVPVDPEVRTPIFGYLKGCVGIRGDLVASTGEVWNADI